MSNIQNLVAAFSLLLSIKNDRLLSQQVEVLSVVHAANRLEKTKEYHAVIEQTDREISDIIRLIRDTQKKLPEFEKIGHEFVEKFEQMKAYVRNASQILTADLSRLMLIENQNSAFAE